MVKGVVGDRVGRIYFILKVRLRNWILLVSYWGIVDDFLVDEYMIIVMF